MTRKELLKNPWNFILYRVDDESYLMKVMFSEGDYKVDVERSFIVTPYINFRSIDIEILKNLSKKNKGRYRAVRNK